MYRAIGFDYGGVIKGGPDPKFLREACELLGITPEQYVATYYKYNKSLNRGEITWSQLWQRFVTDLGQPDKLEQVKGLFAAAAHKELNPRMLELVDKLRASGFKVGLLSNNPREASEEMHREGLDEHFDVVHISAETGYVKPEPEAFIHFAESLGVAVSELIMIDDSRKSLSTAGEVGFTPITFTGYEDLIRELQNLGVSQPQTS